jgi:hypothetical protein
LGAVESLIFLNPFIKTCFQNFVPRFMTGLVID